MHKIRPIYDTPAKRVQGFNSFDDNSLISFPCGNNGGIPTATSIKEAEQEPATNHHDRDNDECLGYNNGKVYNSIDAVEKLLSQDEIDEMSDFPIMSGVYFDRKTQTMKLSNSLRRISVDASKELSQLIKEQQTREARLLEK